VGEEAAMAEQSSYLAYLPPALWRRDDLPPGGDLPPEGDPRATAASPRLDLGAVLRIFEKLATGIADDVAITHPVKDPARRGEVQEDRALTDEIADLHRLFDPWTAPADFLPWLASWVALEFPTLQGEPLWEEYQRRKVTAEIAQIYRLRGRRAGLNQYLELYAVGHTRPRVSVDDGARLVTVTPRPGAPAAVDALVTQGPVVVGNDVRSEGLTRPWCVTLDGDDGLVVGDIGLPDDAAVKLPSRLWRLDPSGQYPLAAPAAPAGTPPRPPRPQPLVNGLATLKDIVGVAVRRAPETLYALTRTGRLFAIPVSDGVPGSFAASTATLVTTLSTPGTPVWMVALAVDPATGDLLAIDRGGPAGEGALPSVVTIRPDPLDVTRTRLTTVLEPLSLAVEPDGTLLIGDGREQEPDPDTPAQIPGNLVRVDRGHAPWTETLLLPADKKGANPLIAPTGIARLAGALYVLDAGLKPFFPSGTFPFICPAAEHAAVYQAELGDAPRLVRITSSGQFVYPTGMVAAGERLVVCDPGQPVVQDPEGLEPYWGRVRPFQFDVVIHFTRSPADAPDAPDADDRKRALHQAVGNISTIVTEQKPAHTVWTLITSIPELPP
jgi:phage tail-like protein